MLTEAKNPYERPPHVQDQLVMLHAMNHSERMAEVPGAYSESLAYFIRRRTRAGEELYEAVFVEVNKRIVRTAHGVVRRLPKSVIEEIVNNVQMQILKLLVANSQDPDGDFFEVGFAQGVVLHPQREAQLPALRDGRPAWVACHRRNG